VNSSSAWKRYFNRIIGNITHGFTHVEFAFRFRTLNSREEIWVACNIYTGEKLQFEFKTATYVEALRSSSTSLWSLFVLALSPQQQVRLLQLCCEQVKRNIGFNNAVYFNFLLPCRRNNRLQTVTFCSEFAAHCLREIGLAQFSEVQPHITDPQMVFDLAQQNFPRAMNLTIGANYQPGTAHLVYD